MIINNLNTHFSTKITLNGILVQANRPEPILGEIDVMPYKYRMDPALAVEVLMSGSSVLVVDFYSSGLAVLSALKVFLEKKYSNKTFKSQRDFRASFRELSHRLLLEVGNHKLKVRKAPEIGWLKILYPEMTEFLLPFPQIQGLNSSWQWYQKGISIPVLNRKIHPFFGTYFPTRFEHLQLFDTWLKQYKGEKKSAFDIGIGSGILSFQMLKNGFGKVFGTDSNPNAIIGLYNELIENQVNSKVELQFGDLFCNFQVKSNLIVFNPPWLPASHNLDGIDRAIYYDDDLFSRFFLEAKNHLAEDGRIVILFSNLAQLSHPGLVHPIENEMLKGGLKVEIFFQQQVGDASKKTKRKPTHRSEEKVELWVLKAD